MIRKFFAVLFILFFVFIMPPLLILQSVAGSFLSEASVAEVIVPQSYDPVVAALAAKFARSPKDTALFVGRIRLVLPSETYVEILRGALHPIFDEMKQFEKDPQTVRLSAVTFKSLLQARVPEIAKRFPQCEPGELKKEEFRFCMPRGSGVQKQMQSMVSQFVEKIPDRIELKLDKQRPEITQGIRAVFIAKHYLPFIIVGVAVVLLGLIALIIFSPKKSVFKWMASALISLAALMALFIVSVTRLLQNDALFQDVPDFQSDLIKLLINFPLQALTQFAFIIGILGIILFVTGLLMKFQNVHNAKKHS